MKYVANWSLYHQASLVVYLTKLPGTNYVVHQQRLGQITGISSGFGSEEPVPSFVRELIIALSSMGDDLRDSVKRYAFITARTLRTPDHNTISY